MMLLQVNFEIKDLNMICFTDFHPVFHPVNSKRLSLEHRADLAGARRGGQAALTEAAARALEQLVAALDEAGRFGVTEASY